MLTETVICMPSTEVRPGQVAAQERVKGHGAEERGGGLRQQRVADAVGDKPFLALQKGMKGTGRHRDTTVSGSQAIRIKPNRSASARRLPSLFSDPVMPIPVAHEILTSPLRISAASAADRDQLAARGLTAMDTPRQRRRIEPAADPASARCRAALVLRQDGK